MNSSIANLPFDEFIDIPTDSDEVTSESSIKIQSKKNPTNQDMSAGSPGFTIEPKMLKAAPDPKLVSIVGRLPSYESDDGDPLDEEEDGDIRVTKKHRRGVKKMLIKKKKASNNSANKLAESSDADEDREDDNDDEDEEDDDDDDSNTDMIDGMYNPADYEHLIVSPDVKEMFQYIQRYAPQTIDLETKLKPFIPEYIAAVGDIDAFIKVPRPDGKSDNLGLTVLDEPCANQSDATVLDLQLRSISKQKTSKEMVVRSIGNDEMQVKEIDKWIRSIGDLHRSKPPPTVHYVKPMPDVSTLMTEWSDTFEEVLRTTVLPSSELDCSLKDFVDIVCAILDIPVYNNRIETLHLLFSLYLEFKNSQHFRHNDDIQPQETKLAT